MSDVWVHPDGTEIWKWVAHDSGEMLLQLLRRPAATVAEHADIPSKPGLYLISEGERTVMVGLANDLRSELHAAVNPDAQGGSTYLSFHLARSTARKAGVDVNRDRKCLETDPAFLAHYSRAKAAVRDLSVRFITHQDRVGRQMLALYTEIHLNAAIASRLHPDWEGKTFVYNVPSVDRGKPQSLAATAAAGSPSFATVERDRAALPCADLEDGVHRPGRSSWPSQVQLGEAIKAIRTEKRLKQEEVAEHAGIHDAYLSVIESGKRNPTWKVVVHISAALEVSVASLVARAEEG